MRIEDAWEIALQFVIACTIFCLTILLLIVLELWLDDGCGPILCC